MTGTVPILLPEEKSRNKRNSLSTVQETAFIRALNNSERAIGSVISVRLFKGIARNGATE